MPTSSPRGWATSIARERGSSAGRPRCQSVRSLHYPRTAPFSTTDLPQLRCLLRRNPHRRTRTRLSLRPVILTRGMACTARIYRSITSGRPTEHYRMPRLIQRQARRRGLSRGRCSWRSWLPSWRPSSSWSGGGWDSGALKGISDASGLSLPKLPALPYTTT